ncbi:unnamed protein product [Pleuronectes platessa]|uniref:Ig-like domain-containing protein n=1 Tax=Pleuronectes platessa TaxID=8262 RepID=A0A9N7W3P8_PLEPL|nr:unnamed protein product [Pleuronectes platessa]
MFPASSQQAEGSIRQPRRVMRHMGRKAKQTGVAVAQRVVTVESGPLIRTEGSHVTIWCNVTGYKDGVEQDFEWSMYLAAAQDREIRIVSTAQPNYAYTVYAQRVNSKEIFVERLSRDSAVLHITKVQAGDQGLFECYTPNTDGRYLGSYSARTNVTEVVSAALPVIKSALELFEPVCERVQQPAEQQALAGTSVTLLLLLKLPYSLTVIDGTIGVTALAEIQIQASTFGSQPPSSVLESAKLHSSTSLNERLHGEMSSHILSSTLGDTETPPPPRSARFHLLSPPHQSGSSRFDLSLVHASAPPVGVGHAGLWLRQYGCSSSSITGEGAHG